MKNRKNKQGLIKGLENTINDLAEIILPQKYRMKIRIWSFAFICATVFSFMAIDILFYEPVEEYLNPVVRIHNISNIQVKEIEVIKWKSVEDDIQGYIEHVFGDEAEHAKKIAKCESGFSPTATNVNVDGTEDRGVFQINNKYHGSCSTHNAKANIDCAKKIKDSWGNWNAWVCNKLI